MKTLSKRQSEVESRGMLTPLSSTRVYEDLPSHSALVIENAPLPKLQLADIENLAIEHGNDLLKVSPTNVTRLKTAFDKDDKKSIDKLLGRREENSESFSESRVSIDNSSSESHFQNAMETYQTEWVKFYIQIFAHESFDFVEGARIIKHNFKTLWKHYNSLAIEILEDDILGRDVRSINVPIEVFTDESNKGRRVGTCDSITEWTPTLEGGTPLNDWLQQNPTGMGSIREQSKTVLVKASVKIYCFEDLCQVGLEGILRFLLLNKAPTSVYKTPLVKHILDFKWERGWKRKTRWRLTWFFMLYVLFPIVLYVAAFIASAFASKRACDIVFYALFAEWLFILAGLKVLRAWRQCGQNIRDNQEIFSSRSLPGIKHYISSQQNIVDLFLFLTKMFIIGDIFYIMLGNTGSRNSPVFSGSLEVFIFVVVVELYYRLQIMKVCGATGMMLKEIVRKCYPYFVLLFLITAAFGLAMWQTTQSSLRSDEDKEDGNELTQNFGNPMKAILTMFYATFGLFDATGMYHYGTVRWLMIPIFILYLAFQMMIILNLLIAAIGDAFDGLRSIEEELFLKARADYIDRSEASLSKKKIKPIKESIGKYLYVLVPEEKHLKKDETSWNGRMIAIKEDVKKIVLDSQEEMTKKINQLNEKMDQQSVRIDEQIQNMMNHLTQSVNLLTGNMNERFKILRDDMRSMDERIKTPENEF
eukprot:g3193.t1